MHRIALSKNPLGFIRTVGKIAREELTVEKPINIDAYQPLNKENKSWLEILVERGKTKSFDAALSPNQGMGWTLRWFYTSEIFDSINDSVVESGNKVIQSSLESFVSFITCLRQYQTIFYGYSKSEDDLLGEDVMEPFRDSANLLAAKVLARFHYDYSGSKL